MSGRRQRSATRRGGAAVADLPRKSPIATAPRDGTPVLLWVAGEAGPVRAYWSVPLQGWVRDDDPHRRVLHGVAGWAAAGS